MPYKPKKILLKEFKNIYSKVPRLCVDLITKTEEGVVLPKRDIPPAKGKWHLPGGTVLYGERMKPPLARRSSTMSAQTNSLGVSFSVLKERARLRRVASIRRIASPALAGPAPHLRVERLGEFGLMQLY